MGDTMQPVRNIAIVGGGTAGWIAASMLARSLPGTGTRITVIESPDIGTIGVGEATIPPIIDLLRYLSINEADFVKHTRATFKLGIKFHDWQRIGSSYWHPFGTFGAPVSRRPFFHAWQHVAATGATLRIDDYSLCASLGDANKFRFPDPAAQTPAAGLRYALHFDAGLVARYLRAYAEKLGVTCLARTVAEATQRADGSIDELIFTDGSRLAAEFYLDCSGFRGLLIEQTLKTGYVDWSDNLPCDRAVAVATELSSPRTPYTQASARAAGWRWRIPLQHRAGNGYVYASAHISDSKALEDLLQQVGEKTLSEPRYLRFLAGRRRLFWNRNVVALGLASGFLEPLESTSIHMVMSAVFKLLEYFPDHSFAPATIDSYNRELIAETEAIRDFIILHFCLTQRDDTPFWNYCRTMKLPASLAERIELYRQSGRIRPGQRELFTDVSWFYIFDGLGLRPERHDPLIEVVPPEQLRGLLTSLSQSIRSLTQAAPAHDSYFAAADSAVAAMQ
jgi:tryptophan halogenase